jgi:hypothetical protein
MMLLANLLRLNQSAFFKWRQNLRKKEACLRTQLLTELRLLLEKLVKHEPVAMALLVFRTTGQYEAPKLKLDSGIGLCHEEKERF